MLHNHWSIQIRRGSKHPRDGDEPSAPRDCQKKGHRVMRSPCRVPDQAVSWCRFGSHHGRDLKLKPLSCDSSLLSGSRKFAARGG